jgi:putative transposase
MAGKERFHGGHFPKRIVLQVVLWYLRYSLSYRDIEELMKERGVGLDHATVQRWGVKYTPSMCNVYKHRQL